MKKKTLLTAISVVLVLTMVISGTLAYLSETSEKKVNNFQKNVVDVDLTEAVTDPFNIIPGTTVTKDPKVTVKVTLPSYVFVKVEDGTDGLVTYSIANGWTKLENGVYYREQAPAGTTTEFTYDVLKENKITYANTITNDDMNAARDNPTLSFTSYVIQKLKSHDLTVEGSTAEYFTPAEAWAVVNGGSTAGTTTAEASSPVATVSDPTEPTTLTADVAPSLDENEQKTKVTKVTVPANALNEGDTAYVKVSTENGVIAITDGSGVAATIDVDLYVNNQKTTTADNTLTGANQYYTVETCITAGLENVGLRYGAETWTDVATGEITGANQFKYDSATGKLVFTTTHFSKFTVTSNAVAYVTETDTVYSDLQSAIDAEGAETVTLLKDVSAAAYISVKKDITIDGKGYALNTTANRGIRIESNDVTLNLKNLSIAGADCERAVQVDGGKKNAVVSIDNCELHATYYTINICNDASVDLTVTDSTLYGWGTINAWEGGYSIKVDGCKLYGLNDKGYNEAGWNDFGTVVIEGDTTNQTTMGASDVTISISNTLISASAKTGNKQWPILFNENSKANKVVLSGCTFDYTTANVDTLFLDNGTDNSLIIDGVEMIDHSSTVIEGGGENMPEE